jgi:hypothetical protein
MKIAISKLHGIVTGLDYMGLYGFMDEIIAGSMGSGWWFQPSPLKNDGLRQLGRLSPNYLKNLGVNMCKSPTQSHTNSK